MKRGCRLARAWSLTGSLMASVVALPQIAWAGDDIRASADVSPTVGYSTNPFAATGSDLGSAYVDIDARPQLRWIGEHDTISLQGNLNFQHYFHRYSNTSDYEGTVDYTGQPTARLSTHADVTYDSAIVGGYDTISTVDPAQPVVSPTTGTDLALFGSRARRRLFNVAGSAGYTLSDRDSLTVNGFYDQSRYNSLVPQSSYDGYGGGAGYSRRMSAHLQLGAQASVNRTDYRGQFGHSQVYSLQATVNDSLNSRWNVTGALGASYARRTVGGNSLSPTGDIQLCDVSPRVTLCATASEQVQPTGFTGTVVAQSVGANYSYRLSERARVSVYGTYTHNKQPNGTIVGDQLVETIGDNQIALVNGYVTVTGHYDRDLWERIHFVATAQYRSITGGIGSRPADFSGSLGLLIKLGEYK